MNREVLEIIDEKAARKYKNLPIKEKINYRAMLYVGVQSTINGQSLPSVAAELGRTVREVRDFADRWARLIANGDPTANLIAIVAQRLPKRSRPVDEDTYSNEEDAFAESANAENCKPVPPSRKTKKVLGFIITAQEEQRRRAVMREAILFMQKYGKGVEPRVNGEYLYFAPPKDSDDTNERWLPLDTAARYCGCYPEAIAEAWRNGLIERRLYKRVTRRNFYEYKVSDLDRFIQENNLI